jgi:hypothetical protein
MDVILSHVVRARWSDGTETLFGVDTVKQANEFIDKLVHAPRAGTFDIIPLADPMYWTASN